MTKFVKYRAKLKGSPALVAIVSPYVQPSGLGLFQYRELQRAVKAIFGDALELEIVGVSRTAQTRTRRL